MGEDWGWIERNITGDKGGEWLQVDCKDVCYKASARPSEDSFDDKTSSAVHLSWKESIF